MWLGILITVYFRAVTKISSCWVCAISRQRIEQLQTQGSSFGSVSVVLLFPIKVAKGLAHISGGKSLVCGPQ